MRKALLFFTIVLFVTSCFEEEKEDSTDVVVVDDLDSNVLIQNSGLDTSMYGEWINAAFFDSTLKYKKIQPWLLQFYGDVQLSIHSSDSATIIGNMDGAKTWLTVIDEKSFLMPDRVDKPVFVYLKDKDLIQLKTNYYEVSFRRVKANDRLDLIGDEEKFTKFFMEKFFTGFHFQDFRPLKVEGLWTGFETYTPFTFDALAIKENNQTVYFGWEIQNDSLKLFETSYTVDEDSGFPDYKKEGLVYILTRK